MPFTKGQSGNPKGRPRGVRDKRRRQRTELRGLLEDSAPKLIGKAVKLALAGDTACLKLCLDRILPTLKPEALLDGGRAPAAGSLVELGRAVVASALNGDVPAGVARELTSALASVARVQEVCELAKRLEALEARSESIPLAPAPPRRGSLPSGAGD